jgi:putative MATE family efflux protein
MIVSSARLALMKKLSKPLIALAIPIMIQGLLLNLMGFVDALMIGQLGEIVISSLGNAQQLLGFLFLMMAAISIGGSVVIAQAKGAKDSLAMDNYSGVMVQSGLLLGVLLGVLVYWLGGDLVALLTTDAFKADSLKSQVPETAQLYLQVVAFAMPFMLLNQMLSAALGASGDTVTPVKVGVFFNVVNFILNWVLIFGMGLPGYWSAVFTPMGFQGAAVATLVASVGQGSLLFIIAKRRDNGINLSFKHLLTFQPIALKRIVILGYPNTVDGFYWQGARIFYTVLMNAIGAIAYAAYTIVRTLKSLFMLPIGGLQTATAIRMGHLLGAGQFKRAKATADTAIIVGMVIMILPSTLLVLFAESLLNLYAVQEETRLLAISCTWILAASLFFTAVNAVIPGLLRSGGDAAAVMHITLLSFILCGAPAAWLFGVYFKLGVVGAFAGVSLEEVFKAGLFYRRMKQFYWLKKIHNQH